MHNAIQEVSAARPYDALPFVSPGISLWRPGRTGGYASDCELGREYADQLIAFMEKAESPALLSHVMKDMGADWGGVEIGFATEMAERLIA